MQVLVCSHMCMNIMHSRTEWRYSCTTLDWRKQAFPRPTTSHHCVVAGSVDEQADEQGIAHLVEHVTFLGSRKREGLLGTGARSNAYTDFHHTVFHVHSPLVNTSSGDPTPMLPQVPSPKADAPAAVALSA